MKKRTLFFRLGAIAILLAIGVDLLQLSQLVFEIFLHQTKRVL